VDGDAGVHLGRFRDETQPALLLGPPDRFEVLGERELAVEVVVLPLGEPVVVLRLARDDLSVLEQPQIADVVVVEVRGDDHRHVQRIDAEQGQPVGRGLDADLAQPVAGRDVVARIEEDHLVGRAHDPEVVLHVQVAVRLAVGRVVVQHHALLRGAFGVLDLQDL
jgi:hypothetical protein